MSTPATLTDQTFQAQALESDLPVLVDFWASWCGPCKLVSPIVEELANEYEGRIKVAKVDVDANPVSPGSLSVMSIPTLILFSGGNPVLRMVGYQSKAALRAQIDKALATKS